jgi:Cu-Zn family superoxide dismutase
VNISSKLLALPLVAAVACTSGTARPTTPPPVSAPPAAQPAPPPAAGATAILHDAAGSRVGNVSLADTHAGLLVSGTVSGLGLGSHGIHLHAVGKCEAPFTSAGGHFNPNNHKHGYRNPDGPHLGDMPNIDTPAAGQYRFEFMVTNVTIHDLLDADGAAVVIHAGRDDYLTDPAGNSGGRIACGVITASK